MDSLDKKNVLFEIINSRKVEEIIDRKRIQGEEHFLVKFKDISAKYSVWFTHEFLDNHLEDFDELEDDFDGLLTVSIYFAFQYTSFS